MVMDHRPVDHRFVVSGQPLVVADGPPAPDDPRQGPLDDPAPGQHLEGVQVIGPPDDSVSFSLSLALAQVTSLPAYPPSAQVSLTEGNALLRFHSSGLAPSRSWTPAAVISTVSSSPIVSTAMCRLRPLSRAVNFPSMTCMTWIEGSPVVVVDVVISCCPSREREVRCGCSGCSCRARRRSHRWCASAGNPLASPATGSPP
jgi:hypothetical protein